MTQETTDTRSPEELVAAHRIERQDDESEWPALGELHRRGGPEELAIALRLVAAADATDRAIGAAVLGQLGLDARTHLDETVGALIPLLEDDDPEVVAAAAVALGHRRDPRAIEPLAALAGNRHAEVRLAVTFGLLTHDDPRAVEALIGLSRDEDRDTRDWAMFGLGSQTDADSPALRDALVAGLEDEDAEVRGEALVGLARRGDPAVGEALVREWKGKTISRLSLEAAERIADPALAAPLRKLQKRFASSDDEWFLRKLQAALEACEKASGGGE